MNITDAKNLTPYELEVIRLLTMMAKSLKSIASGDAEAEIKI